jgi:hypothetical protein
VHQHLREGYGVGLKVEQRTYVFHHHRLESLMRIPSPLFDGHYAFRPTGDRGISNLVKVPAKDVLSGRIASRVALKLS